MREVIVRTATPQNTFDHMFGSGATSYSWWRSVKTLWSDEGQDGNAPDDWAVMVACEDGEDGIKRATITHEKVMETAREIVRMYLSKQEAGRPQVNDDVVKQCAMLIFEADDCDFDAGSADCLLQIMVIGSVVFG